MVAGSSSVPTNLSTFPANQLAPTGKDQQSKQHQGHQPDQGDFSERSPGGEAKAEEHSGDTHRYQEPPTAGHDPRSDSASAFRSPAGPGHWRAGTRRRQP